MKESEKFVFFQYYDLSSEEINNLNILIHEFYKCTGITCIVLPKEVEIMDKQDVDNFINKLKEL